MMTPDRDEAERLAAKTGPVRDVVLGRRPGPGKAAPVPVITDRQLDAVPDRAAENLAERDRAAHELINEAERLARYLRVVSGGHLSLAVVGNHGTTLRERQGMGWHQAHEAVAEVLAAG